MSKTIKELEMEILEYEEMIDELTPQLCGDENDEEFEKEIGYYEMLIKNNKDLIRFLEKKKIQKKRIKIQRNRLSVQRRLQQQHFQNLCGW